RTLAWWFAPRILLVGLSVPHQRPGRHCHPDRNTGCGTTEYHQPEETLGLHFLCLGHVGHGRVSYGNQRAREPGPRSVAADCLDRWRGYWSAVVYLPTTCAGTAFTGCQRLQEPDLYRRGAHRWIDDV